ncbi:hypothetical protein M422DRAFT_265710 [Sphaerobolus stellatus SS14]|uniref:Uncharacterized protein n=1 Tax=Sphaerobolus stellatus (strain SS14) TaxID=990650 RepID=A0A0C9UCU8_SPHS4|nr:hypothetical protein M422DRAFT_265710 [Sphaerobolus stellatus SS14]
MPSTSPKVAIITGASSASNIALSNTGWNVVLFARREEELKSATAECPTPTLIIVGDVTSEGDVKRLFEETLDGFTFFLNAGIAIIGTLIEDLPLERYQTVLNVNVVGRTYNQQRLHFCPYTSSTFYFIYLFQTRSTGITKSTALDGRAFNISVTQIDIGSTLTTMEKPISVGTMQADGVVRPKAIMDVKHAANAVVHIAGLPNTVQVLGMNITCAY